MPSIVNIHPLSKELSCHAKWTNTVASLGWVTPGAATEGATPLFFPEKPDSLFMLIAVIITIAFYCFHSGVTPPSRVSPYTFSPVRPRFSTILCKFAHKNFFPSGVTPWRVSPGAVRPLLVMPLDKQWTHNILLPLKTVWCRQQNKTLSRTSSVQESTCTDYGICFQLEAATAATVL